MPDFPQHEGDAAAEAVLECDSGRPSAVGRLDGVFAVYDSGQGVELFLPAGGTAEAGGDGCDGGVQVGAQGLGAESAELCVFCGE